MAINVLFLCNDNSTRSVMAEALLKRFGDRRFRAFSAGIAPGRAIHPLAQEMLNASGLNVPQDRPKSADGFLSPTAPKMDLVIAMAEEAEPLLRDWPGPVFKAYWRITDPRSEESNHTELWRNFRRAFRELETRMRLLVLVRHQPRPDRRTGELTDTV
jgi:protein-tyrosine-phosphatase